MKSRGPYKKIQGGDGQEVQDLTRSLCMSLGEVISHTPVHQVPCLLEVVLQYARFWYWTALIRVGSLPSVHRRPKVARTRTSLSTDQ
ncbi:uncharacterized protein LOC107799570 isoform X10 [Nicotiana tabacum]|uniref:Uncharacterized protein LOC107799570 isoform X10 n=2 Tax=Nicotiana tabacum TaxID=4097 RepID=A0AC58TSK1_TOBAC|nr:PREDICTED: uncharacterized protein LOC107799570 isoform X5 [Nicotiana tabacum]